MWTLIDVSFQLEFQPEAFVEAMGVAEDDYETDVPEIIFEDGADIGDVAAQIFALEIPLYPRLPDADIQTILADKGAKTDIPSPFDVLKTLKKK